jgi:2-polyprenyl-3-methyl-5-hydroxy-6-metoxy-1,4-benzoquinol methylase
VLFLFECRSSDELIRTLERIPRAVDDWLEEVVVMQDNPSSDLSGAPRSASGRQFVVRLHLNPRPLGYGGGRKAAFEYALRRGFDYSAIMRRGVHPPEGLEVLLRAAVREHHSVVVASRQPHDRSVWSQGARACDLPRAAATRMRNRILNLRVRDYDSSFRVIATRVLERIAFQLNSDDFSFDTQLLIQYRALGLDLHEVPVSPTWREFSGPTDTLRSLLRSCAAAVAYRLHQLHVFRSGRYFVDEGIRYQLKRSDTGSHMQIVNAIRPGSRVLDLGCSQGLLAQPLCERDVRVTGVDVRSPDRVIEELEEYFQRDVEQPLELPTGRIFDYVVVADVIEHVRNRVQLLRNARRYLKEDGRLLISTPNIALWFYRLSLLAGRFEYGPLGVLDETHVHLFTGATFRREVEQAGFHIVDRRVTTLPFEIVFESTGRSRLMRTVSRGYHLLARLWPSMFAYQFILDAEIITLDEEATERQGESFRSGSANGSGLS